MPEPVTKKCSTGSRDAEMSRVVIGQRLAKFRNAALIGVERLAGGKRVHRRPVDEIGARQIALADPERQEAFAATGIVDDFDDPAFWRRDGARAEAIHDRHASLRFSPS
jgi:hypothetical protein